jgi:hypothetical protein
VTHYLYDNHRPASFAVHELIGTDSSAEIPSAGFILKASDELRAAMTLSADQIQTLSITPELLRLTCTNNVETSQEIYSSFLSKLAGPAFDDCQCQGIGINDCFCSVCRVARGNDDLLEFPFYTDADIAAHVPPIYAGIRF